jgi:hypothetical protein
LAEHLSLSLAHQEIAHCDCEKPAPAESKTPRGLVSFFEEVVIDRDRGLHRVITFESYHDSYQMAYRRLGLSPSDRLIGECRRSENSISPPISNLRPRVPETPCPGMLPFNRDTMTVDTQPTEAGCRRILCGNTKAYRQIGFIFSFSILRAWKSAAGAHTHSPSAAPV